MIFVQEAAFSTRYGDRRVAGTVQYVTSDLPPVARDVGDCICVHYASKGSAGVFHLAADFVDMDSQPNVLSRCPEIDTNSTKFPLVPSTLSDFVLNAPPASKWAVVAGKFSLSAIRAAVHTYVTALLNTTVENHQLAYPEEQNANIVFDEGNIIWTFY